MNRIYLDHAATSPVHPEVVATISDTLAHTFGNASSSYQRGRDSRAIIDQARQVFASSLSCQADEIVITSGGSESNNTAIIKTAQANADRGKHIITTAIEHQSVLKPMNYLESLGFEVTYLPVNQDGVVDLDDFDQALRDDTILVSIMHGNNQIGSLQPIKAIGDRLADHQAFFHTDAVQSYCKVPIDVKDLQVDFLSVSAHKINGPKGIGFLYQRQGINLPSLILGGDQESKRRAGTENIPYIAGFAKAVQLRLDHFDDYRKLVKSLKERFIQDLDQEDIDYTINGNLDQSLDHILNVHLKGVESEKLLIQLDLDGVETAAGSACTAGNLTKSHVLVALLGSDHPALSQSLRFSFGYGLSLEDIDQAVSDLAQAIQRLKENKH